MKILLIDVYYYRKGGAETVFFNTGELLKEQGHEVVYFALKWDENLPCEQERYFPESKGTRKGVFRNVVNIVNYFYYADAAKKLQQLLDDEKPDIAHIHLMWGQISPSIFPVLRRNHIPILLTIHDYRIVCPAYSFKDGSQRICEDCKGKYFYKCFTHKCTKNSYLLSFFMGAEQYFRNYFFNPVKYINGLLYVSNFTRNMHIKYMPGLKAIPNRILYNFSIQEALMPKKQIPTDKYFLYFGRLSMEKGVQTLLSAFNETITLDAKLKVVGTGPIDKELKLFKKENHIENVEFLGYKTGKELDDLVKNAYFVIVPSECYENNPMSVVESYSQGVPVIGARIGGIPEIIDEGKIGYSFESGNTKELALCIKKANELVTAEYVEFCRAALQFAHDNMSKNVYYKMLIDFYNQVLKRK